MSSTIFLPSQNCPKAQKSPIFCKNGQGVLYYLILMIEIDIRRPAWGKTGGDRKKESAYGSQSFVLQGRLSKAVHDRRRLGDRGKGRGGRCAQGELLHTLPPAPSRETGVLCELDWDWRYDLMKQHTGQHVLSAVIEQLFGSATNISRGDEFVNQIDLEHALSPGQLVQAQRESNRILREGRAVSAFLVTPQELEAYLPRMRHAISPHESIRLVEIEELDLMGCGGVHVKNTAEVELIKVLGAKNVAGQKGARGEMRVYFLCGDRVMQDYDAKNEAFYELSALLGCEPEALPDRVRDMKEQFDRQGLLLREREERLLNLEAAALLQGLRRRGEHLVARAHLPGCAMRALKGIAEATSALKPESEGTLPAVLLQPKGYSTCHMGTLLKPLLEATGAKGGGGPLFSQTTLPDTPQARAALQDCFDAVERALEGV